MHDWILKEIGFDWAAAKVTFFLEDTSLEERLLVAEGVQELFVPRLNEWGKSKNINEASTSEVSELGLTQLRLEMQSGDVIRVVALRYQLPLPVA